MHPTNGGFSRAPCTPKLGGLCLVHGGTSMMELCKWFLNVILFPPSPFRNGSAPLDASSVPDAHDASPAPSTTHGRCSTGSHGTAPSHDAPSPTAPPSAADAQTPRRPPSGPAPPTERDASPCPTPRIAASSEGSAPLWSPSWATRTTSEGSSSSYGGTFRPTTTS